MAEISRVSLFGKLNKTAYQAIESATVFCKMRGNPYVELVHWIHQLLQSENSDIGCIIRSAQLNAAKIATDIIASLNTLPRGATSISDFSSHLELALEKAWVYASLMYGARQVRSGYILFAMLQNASLRHILSSMSSEFLRIKADDLSDRFEEMTKGSIEDSQTPVDNSFGDYLTEPGTASGARGPSGVLGGEDALRQFCTDMTELARQDKIEHVSMRDEEIRQMIDILMRMRQNNPILTGEAGVGKTAVVEGLAYRIIQGEVPPFLQKSRLLSLDIGLLQAGASMKGEFESRLRSVIDAIVGSPTPIILFIDEAHTLIGAGGQAGTGDAANLLKPMLARGTLRTIAATTWSEYKRHIEKDPALTRRFQVVRVEEPSTERAISMMRGIAAGLEKYHNVQILDEAIEASVMLSSRYITARHLPDKSVSVLDTSCARVAISQHAVPDHIEDQKRQIYCFETEMEIVRNDRSAGYDITERCAEIQKKLDEAHKNLKQITDRWEEEKVLVEKIQNLQAQIRKFDPKDHQDSVSNQDEIISSLRSYLEKLKAVQGENPLVLPIVDKNSVASVVADWTGIPVGKMLKDEIETVLNLETHMGQRIIGQEYALQTIARRVRTSRTHLDDPSKPVGVFMLVGPSGVGKTETALALAEILYGGEQNLITINMSEYQEAHTVSSLKGAPPGYVGYGEGGVLTEAVRRKPYSVILLDEVEKAHPDVHEIFFQVFDKGSMEDGEGRTIDFRNTLILLTSNVASDLIFSLCEDESLYPTPEALIKALRDPLLKVFPAALLGRMVCVPYYPLSHQMLESIVVLHLNKIRDRLYRVYGVHLTYSDEVVSTIVLRCSEPESGGRMIDNIITHTMLAEISSEFLRRILQGLPPVDIALLVQKGEFVYNFASS